MSLTTLIGAFGALLLLLAYGLQEFNVIRGKSYPYNLLNFFGAALLTWYAFLLSSLPFIVLEGIWTLIALWYIARRLFKGHT